MSSLLKPIDPDILKRNLPADIHATINQVSANVNESLNQNIGEFSANTERLAEDFRENTLPATLQKDFDELAEGYAKTLQGELWGKLENVKTALSQAVDAAKAASDVTPELLGQLEMLSSSTDALQKKISGMRDKKESSR